MTRPTVIRDPGFASRFNQALERSPHAPKQRHGRLTWVARELEGRFGIKVSVETVRKWSIGEVAPRSENMSALSRLLTVEEAWLSLGSGTTSAPREKAKAVRRASGTLHYVAGLLMIEGSVLAFPEEGDPVADSYGVDLYVIQDGQQVRVTVGMAAESADGLFTATMRRPHEGNTVIVGVRTAPMSVSLFKVPTSHLTLSVEQADVVFRLDGGRMVIQDGPAVAPLRDLAEI